MSYYKCKCLDLWCVYDPNKTACHHRILLMSLTGRMGFDWIKLCLLGQVKSLWYCLAERKQPLEIIRRTIVQLLYIRVDSDHFGPLRNASSVILEKNYRIGKTRNYYWTSTDEWAGYDYVYKQVIWYDSASVNGCRGSFWLTMGKTLLSAWEPSQECTN